MRGVRLRLKRIGIALNEAQLEPEALILPRIVFSPNRTEKLLGSVERVAVYATLRRRVRNRSCLDPPGGSGRYSTK